MKEIKSDILIAQQLGAALKTGAEALISIAGAYKDEQLSFWEMIPHIMQ